MTLQCWIGRAAAEIGRNAVSKHQIGLSCTVSKLTQDRTAEPVSRDQILRRERGERNIHFACSADHEQDWQPSVLPGCNFWKACIRRGGSLRNEKKVVPRYYPWAAAAVVYPELIDSRTDRGATETSQVHE